MPDTMKERIARAMFESHHAKYAPPESELTWDQMLDDATVKQMYRDRAIAVLSEMAKGATEGMVVAAMIEDERRTERPRVLAGKLGIDAMFNAMLKHAMEE